MRYLIKLDVGIRSLQWRCTMCFGGDVRRQIGTRGVQSETQESLIISDQLQVGHEVNR